MLRPLVLSRLQLVFVRFFSCPCGGVCSSCALGWDLFDLWLGCGFRLSERVGVQGYVGCWTVFPVQMDVFPSHFVLVGCRLMDTLPPYAKHHMPRIRLSFSLSSLLKFSVVLPLIVVRAVDLRCALTVLLLFHFFFFTFHLVFHVVLYVHRHSPHARIALLLHVA